MSKFKFLGQFERDAIPAMLPADFRGMIPMFAKPGVEYSVVLFSYNRERGGVATSSDVRRALAQLPTESRVMAVGTDFTADDSVAGEGRSHCAPNRRVWLDGRFL